MRTTTCKCREEVNAKVDNGELSQALSRNSFITERGRESMTRQACDRRRLNSQFVDNGEVRNCLYRAGWSENHIDFLLYRSQHEHEGD